MNKRILIVDDSFYMRTMLKNMLTDAGWPTMTVEDILPPLWTKLAINAATLQALARWEPRFQLTGAQVLEPTPGGTAGLVLRGEYDGEAVEGTVAF